MHHISVPNGHSFDIQSASQGGGLTGDPPDAAAGARPAGDMPTSAVPATQSSRPAATPAGRTRRVTAATAEADVSGSGILLLQGRVVVRRRVPSAAAAGVDPDPSRPAVVLWDTGAEANFLSRHFIARHQLEDQLQPSAVQVKYGDGTVRKAAGGLDLTLRLLREGAAAYEYSGRFVVADLQPQFDAILGMPFCDLAQPRPDWTGRTISVRPRGPHGQWARCLRATSRPDAADFDCDAPGLVQLTLAAIQRLQASGQAESVGQGRLRLQVRGVERDAAAPGDPDLQRRCAAVLEEYSDVFPEQLPPAAVAGAAPPSGVEHKITLVDGAQPYADRCAACPPQELDELKKQLQEYLDSGRLVPSESPWGTNVIFAKKKDGSLRFCVDYRGLNDLTVRNSYPLPHMDELFDRLQGAQYFSKIDLRTGFYQIPLAEEDRAKTAFRTRYGHFEWTVLPMGLTNAPATFQHLMNHTFREFLDRCVLVFLDDIVVYSQDARRPRAGRPRGAAAPPRRRTVRQGVQVRAVRHEIEFLGHHVGRGGLRVMPDKIKAVQRLAHADQRQRAALVPRPGRLLPPLRGGVQPDRCALTRPHAHEAEGTPAWQWQQHQPQRSTRSRAACNRRRCWRCPTRTSPYVVNTDASDFATGAVLAAGPRAAACSPSPTCRTRCRRRRRATRRTTRRCWPSSTCWASGARTCTADSRSPSASVRTTTRCSTS